MTDKITRCPKCSTAFRVSDVHLQSAKGVVRCGSCLTVFDAKAHMETPRAKKPQPQITKPVVQPTESDTAETSKEYQPESPVNEELQDIPKEPKHESPRPTKNLSMSKAAKKLEKDPYSFADDIITDDEHYAPQKSKADKDHSISSERLKDDDNDDADDESWALDLLKDDSEPEVQLKKVVPVKSQPEQKPGEEENDLDLDIEIEPHDEQEPDNLDAELDVRGDNEPINEDTTENSGFGEFLEDFSDAEVGSSHRKKEPTVSNEQPVEQDEPEIDDQEKTSKTKEAPQLSAGKSTEESIKEILAGIEPDPLEVDWEDEKAPLLKRLLWPSLCFLALLALIAQIAWLEFDRFSKIEPYRSAYAKVCPLVGCVLPELRDLTAIKASNLIVRSHPELDGALLVDVILQNNAPFQQRFPSLTLTFSDIEKQAIASRKFSPDDYLGGELAGSDIMPTDTPVHIAMELMDPGPNAVSYSITISD